MKLKQLLASAASVTLIAAATGLPSAPAQARDYHRDHGRDRGYDQGHRRPSHRRPQYSRFHHRSPRPYYRPYLEPRYYGYPVYFGYPGGRAFGYLGLTAIALRFLDLLNAEQQREHETARAAAAVSQPGEVIVWQSGGASGAVQTTRIGTSTSGLQCREFQQTVTVGGRTEQAYGTACLQPDGHWEIVDTR